MKIEKKNPQLSDQLVTITYKLHTLNMQLGNRNSLPFDATFYDTSKTLLLFLLFLNACNQIETGSTLPKTDIERIQQLHLLDKDEKIYRFYSEFNSEVAGNFYTNKRIAKYWIDERDKSKDVAVFAVYPDIRSIDTTYYAGSTYCPYMLVTKTDGSNFKVCVDGKPKEIKTFFEGAINKWKQSRGLN